MKQSVLDLLRAVGLESQAERIERGDCPLCGCKVDVSAFTEEVERMEFDISGLCPKCQYKVYHTNKFSYLPVMQGVMEFCRKV